MKKISIILLAFFIVACSSSNDESNDSSQDLIIGKWNPDKTVYLLDNQIVEVVGQTMCDARTSYEFMVDKSIDLRSFVPGNNNCEFEINNFEYFNWTKLTEESYKFISKKPDEDEYSNTVIVKFESNSTMFWPDYFEGTTYPNGNTFDERRSYFIKN